MPLLSDNAEDIINDFNISHGHLDYICPDCGSFNTFKFGSSLDIEPYKQNFSISYPCPDCETRIEFKFTMKIEIVSIKKKGGKKNE